MYKKVIPIILITLIMILSITGCASNNTMSSEKDDGKTIKIYTTIYPIYDFTKKIVGDKAYVENLVPVGAEPHDYEPSPKQIAKIYDGDVFIFLGENLEPWAKQIEEQLKKKGVTVVEVGKDIIENNDPHIWLDPILAKQMSKIIYNAVVSVDRENEQYYKKNHTSLEHKFTKLDEDYRQTLSKVKRKDIITGHSAFGYLAARYGLNQISIKGLSPQAEPSPKKMAELVELCKEKNVKYVFFETLASPKLSQTLAKEAGASTMVLNPIGGLTQAEIDNNEDYFSIMEKNLVNLKKALSD